MNVLSRIVCWFAGHRWRRYGKHYLQGATLAPPPAVDEWRQGYRCERCGARSNGFAGYEFE